MWAPWIGHVFPGITPERMVEFNLDQYVAMHTFAVKSELIKA